MLKTGKDDNGERAVKEANKIVSICIRKKRLFLVKCFFVCLTLFIVSLFVVKLI